jgi:hypothetical protein
VITGGLVLLAAGLVVLAAITTTTPIAVIAVAMTLVGLAGPLTIPPVTAVLLNSVGDHEAGTASGVFKHQPPDRRCPRCRGVRRVGRLRKLHERPPNEPDHRGSDRRRRRRHQLATAAPTRRVDRHRRGNAVRTHWTNEQLNALGRAGEIDLMPLREGGSTGRSTTIWIVRVGDDLFIRSYRGREGGWYRAATHTGRGRVSIGATGYDVVFEPAPDVDQAEVDAAYRAKYGRSSYVDAMVTAVAAATTLRLAPALDDGRIDDRHG